VEGAGNVRRCLTFVWCGEIPDLVWDLSRGISVDAIEFAVVGKMLSTNSAYAELARRSLANVGTRLRSSGRDFDGDDFDEVGGAETPELA
jgi:hypothetical protein